MPVAATVAAMLVLFVLVLAMLRLVVAPVPTVVVTHAVLVAVAGMMLDHARTTDTDGERKDQQDTWKITTHRRR